MHEMILCVFDNKWYLSPIDESGLCCVADVGTGLGFWAEGVAEQYPNAQVVGIDLTPRESSVHPNCSFIVSDATEEWVLNQPSMKFDLVHIRSMFGGVKDWPALYKQCFEYVHVSFVCPHAFTYLVFNFEKKSYPLWIRLVC